MTTYIIIGFIVQAVIIIERAIRVPEFFGLVDWKSWVTWASIVGGILYNVLLWPMTVIAEIINIHYGQ